MSGRLCKAADVARLLDVPASWVYAAARRGTLPSVRCGRYLRFAEADIERWIEERRESSGSAGARR